MKKVVLVFCVVAFCLVANGQTISVNDSVKAIREVYAKAQAKLEACNNDINQKNKLEVVQFVNQPGGGPSEFKTEYFYDIDYEWIDDDLYSNIYLNFIRVTDKTGSLPSVSNEFLLGEDGRLLFLYCREPYFSENLQLKFHETRLYFSPDSESSCLIRRIQDDVFTNFDSHHPVEILPEVDLKLRKFQKLCNNFDSLMH